MTTGRNDQCHCGSGKKYKKCCLDKDNEILISQSKLGNDLKFRPREFDDFEKFFKDDPIDQEFYTYLPDISDGENELLEKWWLDYHDLENPDSIKIHIESFMSDHPELLSYLDLGEVVIGELGESYRQEDRLEDYALFLIDFAKRFPEIYSESAGIYNLDIISWLLCSGKKTEINPYFSPYISSPSQYVDQIFDLVDLLVAKDIPEILLSFIEATKDGVLQSEEIIGGKNILIPLIHNKLNPYLKAGYTDADLNDFVEDIVDHLPNEKKEAMLSIWSNRFEDTLRPYGKWEFQSNWNKEKMTEFYFSISDNFMRFLHEDFGVSWTSAQYHSSLIYEYGMSYLDLKKGKNIKKPFDFSKKTIDQVILPIITGFFYKPDPVTFFSMINAIYYFVEYLEKCEMLDGIKPASVRDFSLGLHEAMYAPLLSSNSMTFCFKEFPFWKEK